MLETRRQSAVVSVSISSEEIRRTPDASAAGVVERLTGVSVVGEKYVFVRGLGERYSLASTQQHFSMEDRNVVRAASADGSSPHPRQEDRVSDPLTSNTPTH